METDEKINILLDGLRVLDQEYADLMKVFGETEGESEFRAYREKIREVRKELRQGTLNLTTA